MSNQIPAYRKKTVRTRKGTHHYAVVTLSDGKGCRRDLILGDYGTSASRTAYVKTIAEWEENGRRTIRASAADPTIAELIADYWPVVEETYRLPDGTPTNEVREYKLALRAMNYLYGPTPAKEFGPLALKAVRQLLIAGYTHPKYGEHKPLSRGVVNKRIARVKHMMKWAAANERIPASVYHALMAVEGLKRGRTSARETEPVRAVPRAVVERTLPVLRPTVAAMVRLQLETGMRSGELVIMRPIDIDTTGPVWLYRPSRHKTQHHGHQRSIAIGPRGQEIIRQYLTTDTHAFLFSPARDMEARKQEMRAKRKSKVQPSQLDRSKRNAQRKPHAAYTPTSYARSIANSIKLHNAKASEQDQLPHWHPHQLRHTRAAEIRRAAGLDAARAALGHRSPVITEHYADLDAAKAIEVMLKIG